MGMTTTIEGIAIIDPTFTRMKAAYDACLVANVDIPAQVEEYFGPEITTNNTNATQAHD